MKIAIVGCGVGGMASAIALSRDGHDVTLYERFDKPHPLGAGLLLQPSGLEALSALDLRDTVEACGARVDVLDGRAADGRQVLDLNYARWKPGAYGLGVHRHTLFEALHSALRETNVDVRTGATMARVENLERPILHDSTEAIHGPFDLIIAADGANSPLRKSIAPKAQAPLYPWGAIWTTRADPSGKWNGALRQRYSGASVMIGVLPVGAAPEADPSIPHVAFFWSLREDDHDQWRAGGLNAWRADVARCWPEASQLLDGDLDVSALSFARYRDVRAWPWGQGATLLIGDAAHGTSPQLGQGANLALADAVSLAQALKKAPPIDALKRYRRERWAKVLWVQALSAALTPVFQSRSRLIGWMRDVFLGPMSRLWPFERLMLATLTGAGAVPTMRRPDADPPP